jgi:hypothetical protein
MSVDEEKIKNMLLILQKDFPKWRFIAYEKPEEKNDNR